MNISARILINFWNLFDFSLTCCLISSLDTSSAPVWSIKSLYTLSTPVPITIWNCPPALKHPFTISMSSSLLIFALLVSFNIKRNLVTQCVALCIFSFPPTYSIILEILSLNLVSYSSSYLLILSLFIISNKLFKQVTCLNNFIVIFYIILVNSFWKHFLIYFW